MPPIVAASKALSIGSHWPCRASSRLNCASVTPACDGGRQVAVAMDQQRVELRCADDQIDRRRRPAPSELRSAAAEHGDLSIARRGLKRRRRARCASAGSTICRGTTPSTASAALPCRIAASSIIRSDRPGRPLRPGADDTGPGTSPHRRGVGSTLPGLQRRCGSMRVAHLLHHVEVVVGEHARHVVPLVRADAVLTGDRAAGLDAVGEDLAGDFLGQRRLPRNPLVVADQRVQVAVAGVEDVADRQTRSLAERARSGRALRAASCAARRRPARSSSATRGPSRRTPPCVPSRCARAARRLGHLDGRRAGAAADLLDHGEQLAHFRRRSIELDDQDRVGRRKVRMHGRFSGANRQRVHHLDRGRNDAGADDLRHRRARLADAVERGQQRLHALGLAQDPDDHLRHDGQRAFAADDQAEQIGPGRIGQRAADLHELAVRAAPLRPRARDAR